MEHLKPHKLKRITDNDYILVVIWEARWWEIFSKKREASGMTFDFYGSPNNWFQNKDLTVGVTDKMSKMLDETFKILHRDLQQPEE